MINTQDIEDFKQEAEILLLLGNCNHGEIEGFKTNVIINKKKEARIKQIRQAKILKDYEYYVKNLVNYENEELIFEVCKYVEYLPTVQRTTILNFLKYGNNAVTAHKTKEIHNTVKANFRHAVLKLREMLKESK